MRLASNDVTPVLEIDLHDGRSAASDSRSLALGRDVAQFENGVKMIAISLLLATRSTLSLNEFAVEEFSRQSIFGHPNYMAM